MTTIAWDGTTLAADRRACASGYLYTMSKIARVNGLLVAVSGAGDRVREFQKWIADGSDLATYPKRDQGDGYWIGMVIGPNGLIHRYESSPVPILVEERVHSLGSGRDFARMAMHLGKSATEAVRLASLFDEATGNGVQWLSFNNGGILDI